MVNAADETGSKSYASDISDSIERAVRRLMESGYSRRDALYKIDRTLTVCLGQLGSIGLGDVSKLRRQMLMAGAKLAAEDSRIKREGDANSE